jgi:hypothetical protein
MKSLVKEKIRSRYKKSVLAGMSIRTALVRQMCLTNFLVGSVKKYQNRWKKQTKIILTT